MSEHSTTERTTDGTIESPIPAGENRSLRWGSYLLGLSGIGFIINGIAMLYRVFFTPGFESGVETLGGVTRVELAATNHELVHYVDHLQVNIAGLMVAAGIAVIALSWFGVRRGERWALFTAISIPVIFLAHSLPIHQTAAFSFDAIQHLGPGVVWLPALVSGAGLAYLGLRSANRSAGYAQASTD